MKYKAGEFVEVKLLGLAKIDAVGENEYFLFFADGKRGGGWKEHDIARAASERAFWNEWRRHKRYA